MKNGEWKVNGFDRSLAVGLCRSGINPLLAVILASRGVKDAESARGLISDDMSAVNDPFLLNGMGEAVERINRAVKNGEHIAVYGDYDVDGITSTCLLTSYFRDRGCRCDMYIPERLEEGYGVKESGIKVLAAAGVTLIITVDCGITAADEVKFAKTLGVDMVVTDHHECGAELPEAAAVVDPKRKDSGYPEKALAGVGVAFKLVCALSGGHFEELLEKYGDLVAVGTIADVVPVTGENRIFIRHGLGMIKKGGRVGLKKLCEAAGVDSRAITAGNVGFSLAPRINAAGRLGKTICAAKLLMTSDEKEAEALAAELCELNRQRQTLEGGVFAETLGLLEAHPPEGRPIVLAGENWHQGVTGIVASRLAERYGLPAVVICLTDGIGKGSCRSSGGFNLYEALESCRESIISFGGHEMAAGMTIREELIPELRERLGRYYEDMTSLLTPPSLQVDLEITKPEILSVENVSALSSLEPYGTGNQLPVLCLKSAEITTVMPICSGKHTKLWIERDGEAFECVFFSKTAAELRVREGARADFAFTPQINEFRGRRSVQLNLQGIK